ncbi:hypothetical protein GKE82_09905 [Conexibacter sp. W3-3-2]|uniref:YCII-related domain-containing protein n=1 Tax=Paraconexibacter algicola TaxID=2133960 RepID=A0A2T4UGK8_9ACTN|nr:MULTISPECIES: YciI family protein [Solirubrobacterales]MTD44594.1 hypothetical protein [Conexibacter sp. W3-3-2]PTL58335.1 hypothetical protein C7Y72_01060 [Paraconexibacter algicola]
MELHHVLVYDYVADILERRGPHRDAHLAHAGAARDAGRLLSLGALGDPPHGALGVFAPGVTVEEVEAFAAEDPYVLAGLVTARRVEPWTVAVSATVGG